MTRLRALLPALLALAALLALPSAASAAGPTNGFMGMNPDGLTFDAGPKLDAGLTAMRMRGVESLRVTFYWRAIEPERNAFDFKDADAVVRSASQRGITVLPIIIGTPDWASTWPGKAFAPPSSPAEFGRFAGTLARRYGPNGSFWEANPSVPRRPIRAWQIWNEPAGFEGFRQKTFFWEAKRDGSLETYLSMLRYSRKELRRVDSGAQVVLAGFYGRSWVSMAEIYEGGGRKLFDTVAIHPYASTVSYVRRILTTVRGVMARNGDAKKPMILTEFGWASARGKVPDEDPRFNYEYLKKTETEQASLLRQAYRTFWDERDKLGLRAAYWYTWATADSSTRFPFDYTGLHRLTSAGELVAKPAAKAYRQAAADLSRTR